VIIAAAMIISVALMARGDRPDIEAAPDTPVPAENPA
jgi:hypothetical protein